MRLSAVRKKAREAGVKEHWKHPKTDLIRLIQKTEGNTPCFATRDSCDRSVCLWHQDCLYPQHV
ncbi:MAG: hypothetical protein ACM3OC_06965 [Deltaproteobacteria bacterium]